MALIQVNSSTLRSQAEQLRNLNNQLKGQMESLEGTEADLASMWAGDAKDAFHTAFNNDKVQIENFRTLIEQYIVTLENAAQKYDEEEAKNTSIAATRNY